MLQEKIIKELKNLKKKAEQNRQMHLSISKNTNIINKTIHASALIGSSITAILTFANYDAFTPFLYWLTEDIYKLIIGLFAGFIFIITILEEYLSLGKKAASHESIGRQLTTFIRTVNTLENSQEVTQGDLEKITELYSSLHENAPIIPDRIFLREKQRLLIKIAISKQIEKTPHMSIKLYKMKMKLKYLLPKTTQINDEHGDE